jgi:quinol-cytochrome oxidoreductase complex cytochrome b subunit
MALPSAPKGRNVTLPVLIQPELYFLFVYAVLRSIPKHDCSVSSTSIDSQNPIISRGLISKFCIVAMFVNFSVQNIFV